MNNQAAKTVSDALLGLDFKNVGIGGIVYTIKPPTIKVICRAIHHFSNNTSSLKKTRKEYL